MARKSTIGLVLLALAVAASAGSAHAGDDKKELTPFVGYRFGGEFQSFQTGQKFDVASAADYGLLFDLPVSDEAKLELVVSRQETDIETDGFNGFEKVPVDFTYYHVGALYQPSLDDKIQPFVGGTLGATYLKADTADSASETAFSFAIVGGGKFFFSEHIGIRLDGRLYATFIDSGSSVFCGIGTGGSGCSFGFTGNALWQLEANAGLIIAF